MTVNEDVAYLSEQIQDLVHRIQKKKNEILNNPHAATINGRSVWVGNQRA